MSCFLCSSFLFPFYISDLYLKRNGSCLRGGLFKLKNNSRNVYLHWNEIINQKILSGFLLFSVSILFSLLKIIYVDFFINTWNKILEKNVIVLTLIAIAASIIKHHGLWLILNTF